MVKKSKALLGGKYVSSKKTFQNAMIRSLMIAKSMSRIEAEHRIAFLEGKHVLPEVAQSSSRELALLRGSAQGRKILAATNAKAKRYLLNKTRTLRKFGKSNRTKIY